MEEEEVGYPLGWLLADGFSAASLVTLTAVAVYWTVTHTPKTVTPFHGVAPALSVLIGPLGCFLRFFLSRYNGSIPGGLSWFPLGTFLANMGGCLANFCIRSGLDRAAAPLPFMLEALLMAVMTGFSGSLSTVSTWVVELQLLLIAFPANRRGYTYMLASIFGGLSLGVVIYGTATWTAPHRLVA